MGLKYCTCTRKRNEAKHVMKKIILKCNITKYIEYKHENIRTSYKSIHIHEILKNSIIEIFFWTFCFRLVRFN